MNSRIACTLTILCLPLPVLAAPSKERAITFEDRVAAQRAIEQVYWDQRIWPKENPGQKPALSAVVSEAELRARVATYLRQSSALERFWQRPLSAEQLQAELDRMAKATRNAGTLRRLYAALGNDPARIAETLARQTLASRLVRSWYAFDQRIHGETRAHAEAARSSCATAACMASMGGRYVETRWRLADDAAGTAIRDDDHDIRLDAAEWRTLLDRLSREGSDSGDAALPLKTLGRLEETADGFSVTTILEQSSDCLTTASVVWDKRRFEDWWRSVADDLRASVAVPRGDYTLSAVGAPLTEDCTVDTWSGLVEAPARSGHSAVWTGSELIVWGGSGGPAGEYRDSGLRYDPATDTWAALSRSALSPSGRAGHTAVWTGSEMLIWGGINIYASVTAGGRYDPTTDSWQTLIGANEPVGRAGHVAAWTGSRMIVWGGIGNNSQYLNSGARYDPSTDSWQATTTVGAPAARASATAVWTGSMMIVWGGRQNLELLNTGSRYDPSSNTWQATSIGANTPPPAYGHTAVWTGSRMILFGGTNSTSQQYYGGTLYDPAADTWQPTSTANAPPGRIYHTAVWTGTEMIIWGGGLAQSTGFFDTGGRYDPGSDSWVAVPSRANTPSARRSQSAVWTGTEMIIWGGTENAGFPGETREVASGGRYAPATDSWVATSIPASDVPTERMNHAAVWTGSEMVVWGGITIEGSVRSGGRYTPATGTWEPTPENGGSVPAGRHTHSAIWSGTEMIVWGGLGSNGGGGTAYHDSGGRYNPSSDSWTTTARNGACPSARFGHAAVWTGTQMIVWGGNDGTTRVNTGGRYTPGSDSWLSTATAGAPSARASASGVWTGSQMIVWGGQTSQAGPAENTGGRYNPSGNSWQPTSVGAFVPSSRLGHTAVWTGSRMVVWGGTSGTPNYTQFMTGGQYDPIADSWIPTALTPGTPAARDGHTAVWTGTEMIVWGGTVANQVNTGGRYNPTSHTWLPTPMSGHVPYPRGSHTAVWTGSEMMIWGGWAGIAEIGLRVLGSGSAYCADHCASPATLYRDADGDGYGDPSVTQISCGSPAGYVALAGDCDDSRPEAHPGASEVCNFLDDDCDIEFDEDIPAPTGSPLLTQSRAGTYAVLSWTSVAGTTGYDIVVGDLGLLHASMGDFTSSTTGCLVNDINDLTVFDSGFSPPPGGGSWHLVRAMNYCSGNASYDDGQQQGSRDAEIAASGQACP